MSTVEVPPNEALRLAQEVYFEEYRLGTSSGHVLGEVKIQRGSDGLWWNGTAFQATEGWLATADGLNHHYYDFTVPATVDEFYLVSMRPQGDNAALDSLEILCRQPTIDTPPPVEAGSSGLKAVLVP